MRLETHSHGRLIARHAVLAIVVVVVIVVVAVVVAVAAAAVIGITLKICGSEEQTAENRPWQSEAADSRLLVCWVRTRPEEAGSCLTTT